MKHITVPDSKVTIFENAQIHDGMFVGEFSPNEKNQTKNRYNAQTGTSNYH